MNANSTEVNSTRFFEIEYVFPSTSRGCQPRNACRSLNGIGFEYVINIFFHIPFIHKVEEMARTRFRIALDEAAVGGGGRNADFLLFREYCSHSLSR